MTKPWTTIDWDAIDSGYTSQTHANDSGLVKDQLKAALFNMYEENFQMHHDRVQNAGLEGTIASASSMNIGAAIEDFLTVTGAVTITGFDTVDAGVTRRLLFGQALQINHSAALVLPGAANLQAYVGDVFTFTSRGSGNWECTNVQRRGYAAGGLVDSNYVENRTLASITAPYVANRLNPLTTAISVSVFGTISYTPKYTDSILYIEGHTQGEFGGFSRDLVVGLFKDAEVNAREVSYQDVQAGSSKANSFCRRILHKDVAAAAGVAQIWDMRIATTVSSSSGFTRNGVGGGTAWNQGGAVSQGSNWLRVLEVRP